MAVVAALMIMLLLVAWGTALALLTATEIRLSGNQYAAIDALHAAEAAAAIAADEVLAAGDWNGLLAGEMRSAFVDGAPAGTRQTPAGTIDLARESSDLRCGRVSGCTVGDIGAVTAERPSGANNPVWQPYAYGMLRDMLAGDSGPAAYVVVWVGDDRAECDGRPDVDGGMCAGGENPGAGIITLQAFAYGLGGVQRGVELTVARAEGPGVSVPRRTGIVSWREIR